MNHGKNSQNEEIYESDWNDNIFNVEFIWTEQFKYSTQYIAVVCEQPIPDFQSLVYL